MVIELRCWELAVAVILAEAVTVVGAQALVAAEIVRDDLHKLAVKPVADLGRIRPTLFIARAFIGAETMALAITFTGVVTVIVCADEVDNWLGGAHALARRERVFSKETVLVCGHSLGLRLGHPEGNLLLLGVTVTKFVARMLNSQA